MSIDIHLLLQLCLFFVTSLPFFIVSISLLPPYHFLLLLDRRALFFTLALFIFDLIIIFIVMHHFPRFSSQRIIAFRIHKENSVHSQCKVSSNVVQKIYNLNV